MYEGAFSDVTAHVFTDGEGTNNSTYPRWPDHLLEIIALRNVSNRVSYSVV